MRKISSIILVFCMMILSFFAVGCLPHKYRGENVDLYTVAVNSIFKAHGSYSNGEAIFDPVIEIIEKDEYGRVLFFYYEGSGRGNKSYSVLIMQKSTEDTVYFYEDHCYVTYEIVDEEPFWYGDYYKVYEGVDYSSLKECNDWGKEINEEKCVKKPLTILNESALEVSEEDFDEIIASYVKTIGYKGDDARSIHRYDVYSTSDAYGRALYYVYGIGSDALGEGVSPDSVRRYFDFAIIFNPDGSYNSDICITEIEDTVHCKEQLIEFKKLNGWNQPYENKQGA